MNTAEKCVEYLRINKIGVGKFLSMEFCKSYPNPNFKVPDNSKRLIDLI